MGRLRRRLDPLGHAAPVHQGERPGAGAVAGLLLILAGSWLSTDGRLPPGAAAVVTRLRPAKV